MSPASRASASLEPVAPGAGFPSLLDPEGTWLLQGSGDLLSLHKDGTYARDGRGAIDTDPEDTGTFVLDDTARTLTLTSGEDSRRCVAGEMLIWRDVKLERLGDRATLRGVITNDPCGDAVGTESTWIRLMLPE